VNGVLTGDPNAVYEDAKCLYTILDVIFEIIQECTPASSLCNIPPHFSPTTPEKYYKEVAKCKDDSGDCQYCPFIKGKGGTILIDAFDYDVDQHVSILNGVLPDEARFDLIQVGIKPDPFEERSTDTAPWGNWTGQDKAWAQYGLFWVPTIDSPSKTVCFQVRSYL
jgi:hypothetical protein